jgi:branched-chain amino acid transport system permease protein
MAAMLVPVSPLLGNSFISAVFVITVLGGIGTLGGAIVAGFLFGLIQSIASAVWGVGTQEIVAFSFFLIALVLRPQGMFGRKYFGENT